ncbi:MAG: hypothetical protein U9Q82_11085 [Chloroflexota bacterium]|nr:hypothetical protein [Chloroflexota bacterium]
MNEIKDEMSRSKINAIANTRGKYALQVQYDEVLEEFFDILESHSIKVSDFSKNDIEDLLDTVEFASVAGFLHEIIFSKIQPRL